MSVYVSLVELPWTLISEEQSGFILVKNSWNFISEILHIFKKEKTGFVVLSFHVVSLLYCCSPSSHRMLIVAHLIAMDYCIVAEKLEPFQR